MVAENKNKQVSYFRFKPFVVYQQHNAHKTGTDSVLLACFTNEVLKNNDADISSVLDIGTGTGILAMFCAVFFEKARIDAIEINPENAQEAKHNVTVNAFDEKISVFCCALQQFTPKKTYDLIISNPPYFEQSKKNTADNKSLARHTDSLSVTEIIRFAQQHLSANGLLSIIIPQTVWEKHKIFALEQFWLVADLLCESKHSVLRVVILSKQQTGKTYFRKLPIRDAAGNYTKEFIDLTKFVYLDEAYLGNS